MESIDEIIFADLNGIPISPEEREKLDKWLSVEDNRREYSFLTQYWREDNSNLQQLEDSSWDKLKKRVTEKQNFKSSKTSGNKVNLLTRNVAFYFYRIAAVLVLLAGAYLFHLDFSKVQPEQINQELFTLKENKKGIRSTLKLPDGTMVKLNVNSKLKVPNQFKPDERRVYLEGEAYFDVVKDSTRPFIIESGDLQTTVKGTSFNVNAYPKNNKVQVAVAEGLVEVKSKGKKLLLAENEAAELDLEKELLERVSFNKNAIAWKDGILIFNNTNLKELFSDIENWYGVKIVLGKDIKMLEKITASYDNASLKTVLESISYSANFKYEINGDVVTIY
ncbi:FecR family protein [Flexithrix dorotheae]|uniref:FecR family protein n=1 Tax=Flexithrix dorotheae TaxID=70993 RepID=UPI000364A305|nr:FecR family protein [Flexithrix dorotheae]